MTDDKQTKLDIQNSHRSVTKVRRLTPEELDITLDEMDEQDEKAQWESLRETAIKAASESKAGVAVQTDDGTVSSGSWLSKGASQDVHALELAVWKGYDTSNSPVVNVVVASEDSMILPCGRCLQTLSDYSSDQEVSIQITDVSNVEEYSLADLHPQED